MPTTDTRTCLPRFGNNLIRCTTFNVPNESLTLFLIKNLSEQHRLVFATMLQHIMIIEMSCYLHARITHGIEWQHRCIEVNQVGMIAIDSIKRSIIEISSIRNGW